MNVELIATYPGGLNPTTRNYPELGFDPDIDKRFTYLVQRGRSLLYETAILDPDREVTEKDLRAISDFYISTSPVRVGYKQQADPRAKDKSTFGNYDKRGGLLEHFELSRRGGIVLTTLLQEHLLPAGQVAHEWRQHHDALSNANPNFIAAAGTLHDAGKLVTFEFMPAEYFGETLLEAIGVRPDIIEILPSEDIMLTPTEENMDDAIRSSPPLAPVVRIIDEFAKRAATGNTYTPADYDIWDAHAWVSSYADFSKKPSSGRKIDRAWRKDANPLHADNKERYFIGLETYLSQVTDGLHLGDIAQAFHRDPEMLEILKRYH